MTTNKRSSIEKPWGRGCGDLAVKVLQKLNNTDGLQSLIADVLSLVKGETGLDAVGIRLQDGDDFPYYAHDGLPPELVEKADSLCVRDENGDILRDTDGKALLECVCGDVIHRRTDPSLAFFTEGGSFWTNSASELLAAESNRDRRLFARHHCVNAGYESMALVPLRADGNVIGLLQLCDRRKNCFAPEFIECSEGLALSIGIAIERIKVTDELRSAFVKLNEVQQREVAHERLNTLGEMIGGIIHDLNNAIQPVVGFTDLLLTNESILEDDKERESVLRGIRFAAQHAQELISRLCDLYRPSSRGVVSEVDVAALFSQVVNFTKPKWLTQARSQGRHIRMDSEVKMTSPLVADATQLQEALVNLILNAVDAMPKGGAITLKAFEEGNRAVIAVSDTGQGMSEQVRTRCFDPLFTTKGNAGTGMGLTMVRRIVAKHGGTVDVESEIGKGTTFTMRIPIGQDVRHFHPSPGNILN